MQNYKILGEQVFLKIHSTLVNTRGSLLKIKIIKTNLQIIIVNSHVQMACEGPGDHKEITQLQ